MTRCSDWRPVRTVTATLAGAVLAVAAAAYDGGDRYTPTPPLLPPLVFAAIPDQHPARLQQSYQPVLRMLNYVTGRDIRFVTADSYEMVIEAVAGGRVDMVSSGAMTYVKAKARGAKITAVAARVTRKDNVPGYWSYAITRRDTSIQSLSDYRGRRVCVADKNSTSGYFYPAAALLKEKLDPATDMTIVIRGSHEQAVLGVVTRVCDAGFVDNTMIEDMVKRKQIKPGQLRIVQRWQVPGAPLAVADSLAGDLRETVVEALQKYANSDYLRERGFCQVHCPVASGDAYGFAAISDDSDYDEISRLCTDARLSCG